ncbi:hypothetical protein KKA96_01975 [Patescibacteria group bacterium]|nr:hypothetical protein [Patescibacteria group bacterium]MBU4141826.1 hypothetical protein [Patescibacteria group bacterium]MCG2701130.1 hypothetical protein [Candidatus Parcubacteria bacterium]
MLKEIFMRHTIKPKGEDRESEKYKGASENGVELGKEKAREVMELLEKSKEGAVIFIGGASDAIRTKSMDRILGDEIKRIIKEENREDIIALTEEDIADKEKGYSQIVQEVVKKIEDNPDKKIVVEFPLFIKEFAMGGRWVEENGQYTDYTKAILAKHNNNEVECLKDWIGNEGHLDNLTGPNPTEVAKEHLQGAKRLREFAEKYVKDRPIIIGSAGHSWNFDALAVFLANNGKVDLEGLEKVGGQMIGVTEMARIEADGDDCKLIYKNKEFPIEI